MADVLASALGPRRRDGPLTAEVWTKHGLQTQDILFAIDIKTRRLELAGITPHPTEAFIGQVARNQTDPVDGFLRGHLVLICDRDTKFTEQFKTVLSDAGIQVTLIPYLAPNCNAFAERFVLSIKSECLERMIFFGARSLNRAIRSYLAHYNEEHPHQGIGNVPISGQSSPQLGRVHCHERLGGLLKHYHRASA